MKETVSVPRELMLSLSEYFEERAEPESDDFDANPQVANVEGSFWIRIEQALTPSPEQVRCPTCKLTDVEVLHSCHNSSCPEYAHERSVFRGWEDQALTPVEREPAERDVGVSLCAKCGYGSQEHGMSGHPAYQCIADMRAFPSAPYRTAQAVEPTEQAGDVGQRLLADFGRRILDRFQRYWMQDIEAYDIQDDLYASGVYAPQIVTSDECEADDCECFSAGAFDHDGKTECMTLAPSVKTFLKEKGHE